MARNPFHASTHPHTPHHTAEQSGGCLTDTTRSLPLLHPASYQAPPVSGKAVSTPSPSPCLMIHVCSSLSRHTPIHPRPTSGPDKSFHVRFSHSSVTFCLMHLASLDISIIQSCNVRRVIFSIFPLSGCDLFRGVKTSHSNIEIE